MRPQPTLVEVCSECRLPWQSHLGLTQGSGPVRRKHCVMLLRRANQGPPGPTGPMGVPGPAVPGLVVQR